MSQYNYSLILGLILGFLITFYVTSNPYPDDYDLLGYKMYFDYSKITEFENIEFNMNYSVDVNDQVLQILKYSCDDIVYNCEIEYGIFSSSPPNSVILHNFNGLLVTPEGDKIFVLKKLVFE